MLDCPAEIDLERYVAGACKAPARDQIESHVEACARCATWVREAREDDGWLSGVQRVLAEEPEPALGGEVAGFRILRELGRGGMGVVYEAEQQKPKRAVALKVIRPGIASERMLRRFEHEAQVLARLQHPGIAQIHAAGTFESGGSEQPFFAMELVRGRPLLDFLAVRDAGRSERLRVFVKICDAVQHAHQKGVIHRDLKPSNIVVDPQAGPKVLDFGVARVADDRMELGSLDTEAGQLVGTLPYMSPEQVAGRPDDVDVRTDVYALGAILFEMLTGRLPHDVAGKPVTEVLRIIAEREALRLGSVDSALRGDLETIAGKALDTDKERRYASASELARDVERFLAHEPIAARPATAVYQLRKFAARNKTLVIAAAVVFLALVGGIIGTGTQAARAHRAETAALVKQRQAEEEAATHSAVSAFLERVIVQANPYIAKQADPTLRQAIDEAAKWAGAYLADAPKVEARVRIAIGKAFHGLGEWDKSDEHFEIARALTQRHLGPDDPQLATVLMCLGHNASSRGNFKATVTRFRRAVTILERSDEVPARDLAEARSGLGKALVQILRPREAEPLLKKALDVFRGLSREASGEELYVTLHALADARRLLDDPQEALRLRREALAIAHETWTTDHVRLADALLSLAEQLRMTPGGMREAEKLAREAIDMYRRLFGAEHRQLARAIYELGIIYLDGGNAGRARKCLERSLEMTRKVLGPRHPSVAAGAAMLSRAYVREQRVDEAEQLLREALQITKENPEASGEIYREEYWLGELLALTGRPEEGEPFLERSLARARELFPNGSTWVWRVQSTLAMCRAFLGDFEDAEKLALEAHERLTQVPHAELHTPRSARILARIYTRWGKPDEAEKWRQ